MKEVQKDKYLLGGYSTSNISGDKTENSRGADDFWVVNLNYSTTLTAASAMNVTLPTQKNINDRSFFVYPIPARNVINVRASGQSVFSLSDNSGKIVLTKTIQGNGVIDVSTLTTGIYYLKNSTSGTTKTVVVIK